MKPLQRLYLSTQASALIELAVILPVVLMLAFGAYEFGHAINSSVVLSHLTREAGNVLSREPTTIGSTTWATAINGNLVTVIDAAIPVVNRSGSGPTGPQQFNVIYSLVEWRADLPVCDRNLNITLPMSCLGNIANGSQDRYRVRRSNTGWAGSVTWTYGSLGRTSRMGADGTCACAKLPQIKQLTTQGLYLHIVETFYDFSAVRLTPLHRFIGDTILGELYRRSVYMQ